MAKIQVVRFIAETLMRIENLNKRNALGVDVRMVEQSLRQWVYKNGPSGSGIDAGTELDESSTPECVKLRCGFHHMDEHGGYDGWTEHLIWAHPSFVFGVTLTVGGRDRNNIKDYLHQTYHAWLTEEIEHPGLVERI